MHNRIVTLAIVIGLLVGAAGVGLLIVTDDDEGTALDAGLPKLPAALSVERAMAADAMLAAEVTYQVRGKLPDLAREAAAYRTAGGVDDEDVERLARGLGLDGRVERAKGGWQVVDDDLRLVVGTGSGSPWTLGPAEECGEVDLSSPDGVTSSCAVASRPACPPDQPCPEPTKPTLPPESVARTTALDALEKAGIDTSGSVQVFDAFDAWEVMTERRVDGARTNGLASQLSVGPSTELLRGGGLLGELEKVGDYPLVTVTEGVERLRNLSSPRPMLRLGAAEPAMDTMVAPVPPDGGAPPTPVVRTVTDAELGLMPVYVDDRTWLEPAFLFELDDKETVAVPAVVEELLERPGGDWAPYPGAEPAPAPEPGPPGQIEPAPPTGGGSGSSQSCSGSAAASSSNADQDNQPLVIEVCASPSQPAVGQTVTFDFKAQDPDAAIDAEGCQQPRAAYGDEGDGTAQCLSLCQKDNPSPESMTLGRTFTHAYAKPGTYKATFTVGSCAPKASSGMVTLEVVVRG